MVAPLCNNVKNIKNNENEDQALNSTDNELDNIRYTDFYVIGRIWINVLKTCLIGENFNLFPVVKATTSGEPPKKKSAKPEEPPKKPPYMKFKDLSLYMSPHSAYKEYVGDKIKSPDANVKLFHRYLLPYVKEVRQINQKALCKAWCSLRTKTRNAREAVMTFKNDFKQTMRAPDNLAVRQAVMAAGGLAGYMMGGGGGIPRRLFFTSAGLLSAGALCFPKETDEIFRNTAFVAAKSFLKLFNILAGTNYNLREKLPCRNKPAESPPDKKPVKDPLQ